jgi:hypothetical protein
MKPTRFRSKPTEVEAMLVTEDNYTEVADWCDGGYTVSPKTMHSPGYVSVEVPTNAGNASAKLGWWVVKGPHDFYPVDPQTFEARWEIAE